MGFRGETSVGVRTGRIATQHFRITFFFRPFFKKICVFFQADNIDYKKHVRARETTWDFVTTDPLESSPALLLTVHLTGQG